MQKKHLNKNRLQTQQAPAPAVNPITGQPDYSAQWIEYYRAMGMHDQAALIEQQARQQREQAVVQQRAGAPQGGAPQPAQQQAMPQVSGRTFDLYK